MGSLSTRRQGACLNTAIFIDNEDDMNLLTDMFDIAEGPDGIGANKPHIYVIDDSVQLPPETYELDSYTKDNHRIRKGTDVQFSDGSLQRVYQILQAPEGVYLKGIPLEYLSQVDPTSWGGYSHPDKIHGEENEVCAIIQHEAAISDPSISSGLVNGLVSDVLRVRKVVFSNEIGPLHHIFTNHTNDRHSAYEGNILICRWKCAIKKKKTTYGLEARDFQILHLREDECDPGHGKTNHELYLDWCKQVRRGKAISTKTPNGIKWEHRRTTRSKEIIDLTGNQEVIDLTVDHGVLPSQSTAKHRSILARFPIKKGMTRSVFQAPSKHLDRISVQTQRTEASRMAVNHSQPRPAEYNYADVLCGGGGSAVGAHQAGLAVKYAIDSDMKACLTLELNIPSCQVLRNDLTEWITKTAESIDVSGVMIDVLHVSFTCKGFSIANRGLNPESDEVNISLSYALDALLKKVRPRVLTMEQVDGIFAHTERSRAGQHLYSQFNTLTSLGYQLRCGVLRMSDYGVASIRRRLITIASCPGQELPPWPKPTHGDGPGLQTPVTVRDVLAQAPRGEEGPMGQYNRSPNGWVFNPGQRLAPTITCSGSIMHPDGHRFLTLRELAMVMGFPADYQFEGNMTEIRRQISNAVPPPFAKALFTIVKETLEKTDAEFAAIEATVMDTS